jgi:hypothetical protein
MKKTEGIVIIKKGTFEMRKLLGIMIAVCFLQAGLSEATLILSIDEFTATNISFTISGTLDEDTAGPQPGWFAIKNDWVNNQGVHTDWFDGNLGIIENTIKIGGTDVTETVFTGVGYESVTYGDSVYFRISTAAVSAGTEISGNLRVTGTFVDPSTANLQLISGFNNTNNDWYRLEATGVVPEPASMLMLAFGGGLLGLIRRFYARA